MGREELSGTAVLCQELPVKMYLLACALVSLAPLSSAMDLGRSGVYGSPMAQDFYVRRFGFLFGGGRSGMFGLKALQADGLVEARKEVPPAVEMRNSVNTYYNNVMPGVVRNTRVKRLRGGRVSQGRVMVELEPKMIGIKAPKMFHRFMAVP